jgi:glycosidase
VADQVAVEGSLLDHYRSLIAARGQSPALGSGRLVRLDSGQEPVLAFLREGAGERVLVAVNLGGSITVAGPLAVDGIPLEAVYADGTPGPPSGSPGRWSITLPPYATAVWRYSAGTSLTSAAHAPAAPAKVTSTR